MALLKSVLIPYLEAFLCSIGVALIIGDLVLLSLARPLAHAAADQGQPCPPPERQFSVIVHLASNRQAPLLNAEYTV
jgi:hypothetical protein